MHPSIAADSDGPETRVARAIHWHVPRIVMPFEGRTDMHHRNALLALLGDGESHGYELLKRFNLRLGPLWHPNIGQVYQLLHELERRSLVARRDEASGTRVRRLFRLTPRGERALRTWLDRRPGWPPPLREEIFVRVLAAERHGVDAVLTQLERQEHEYRRYLTLVTEEAARPNTPVSRRLAHEAAIGQAEAHLRWLVRCREVLASPVRAGIRRETAAPPRDRRAATG
jgi:DNA-binding PadR family transcriptional regulator